MIKLKSKEDEIIKKKAFEKIVQEKLKNEDGTSFLSPGLTFGKIKEVYISTDGYFLIGEYTCIVELNTYNMPKPLVGQYLLLNSLFEQSNDQIALVREKSIFIIISKASDLKCDTIERYFKHINEKYLFSKGIKYVCLEYNEEDFSAKYLQNKITSKIGDITSETTK